MSPLKEHKHIFLSLTSEFFFPPIKFINNYLVQWVNKICPMHGAESLFSIKEIISGI